jgi:hypothetical protein
MSLSCCSPSTDSGMSHVIGPTEWFCNVTLAALLYAFEVVQGLGAVDTKDVAERVH